MKVSTIALVLLVIALASTWHAGKMGQTPKTVNEFGNEADDLVWQVGRKAADVG
jgi:hypothetical protein